MVEFVKRSLNFILQREHTGLCFGILLAYAIAVLSSHLAILFGQKILQFQISPVSPIVFAILLGVILNSIADIPSHWQKGFKVCTTLILQVGIVLLGFRLSLGEVGKIGLLAVPIILVCMFTALSVALLLGSKLGIKRRLAALLAVGTGICGCTAIVAVAPLVRASSTDIKYAIATITGLGLIALLLYPYIAAYMFNGDPHRVGYFLGTAIHDTSQVLGAGLAYQAQYSAPEALNVATVTKLIRNSMMVAIIPIIGFFANRYYSDGETGGGGSRIPLFVIGFLAAIFLRTLGDQGDLALGFLERGFYEKVMFYIDSVAPQFLTIAMAGLGLSASISRSENWDWRPFLLGFVVTVIVGCMSVLSINIILSF